MTQRDRFFDTIINNINNDTIIITCDMGSSSLNKIKNSKVLINIGPCEQLSINIGAGLALKGKRPFIYGIDSFISTRGLEQIRLLCSMNLPVIIVGVGGGLSYDLAGLTHHGTESLSILRSIPNLTICNISTLEMAEYYAKISLDFETPLYIRLDKKSYSCNKQIDKDLGYIFHSFPENDEKPIIISTGTITHYLKKFVGNILGLIEVFQFPYNEYHLMGMIGNRMVISVEESYKIGGLGDSLSFLPNVTKIGFDNFCEAKPREEYWKGLLGVVLKHEV